MAGCRPGLALPADRRGNVVRYRKIDDAGDAVFGGGQDSFWVNVPDAVAQAISTRLLLLTGEYFLDVAEGTPWRQSILGAGTTSTYDAVLRARILGTQGANQMLSYSSSKVGRALSVTAQVNTIYGPVTVTETL